MQPFSTEFLEAKKLIVEARRIVIISHRGPDGDTVGSNLALRLMLRHELHKEVISADVDPLARSDQTLPEAENYVRDFDLSWPDLIITVDCGAHYMTKFHETKPDIFKGKIPVINIDHHPSNDRFGTVNIVADTAAATTQIIFHFLNFCGWRIDRHVATCLLHGLYYDTGSFMHSNVSPEVLTIASELLWKGADFRTIVKHQFHTMPVAQLKIYGKILEKAHVNKKGMTVSALTEKDFEETGASPDDTTGSIDFLNSIPDGKFCCLIYEDRKGSLKGSFRSRVDDINLSKLAGIFGGGGHKKAAGFSLPGKLSEENSRIMIQ